MMDISTCLTRVVWGLSQISWFLSQGTGDRGKSCILVSEVKDQISQWIVTLVGVIWIRVATQLSKMCSSWCVINPLTTQRWFSLKSKFLNSHSHWPSNFTLRKWTSLPVCVYLRVAYISEKWKEIKRLTVQKFKQWCILMTKYYTIFVFYKEYSLTQENSYNMHFKTCRTIHVKYNLNYVKIYVYRSIEKNGKDIHENRKYLFTVIC